MSKHSNLALVLVLLAGCISLSCCDCEEFVDDYAPVTFEVHADTAYMNGVIDHRTPPAVADLILTHPEVTTIAMIDVPGSADDSANLEAALMIREAGLNTYVPWEGIIASGGVDFFLAGNQRKIESWSRLGVHSWAEEDEEGNIVVPLDLPEDDPGHLMFLEFYRKIDIPEEFYWYTLKVAPAEGIHWMLPDEISRYQIVTDSMKSWGTSNRL